MGMTATAHVGFGWPLSNEPCAWRPGHENCTNEQGFWECVGGGHEDEFDLDEVIAHVVDPSLRDRYPYDENGNYLPGKGEADGSRYYREQREAAEAFDCPFVIDYDGSLVDGETGMLVVLKGSVRVAYWHAEPLGALVGTPSSEKDMRAAAEKIGLRLPKEPARWLLWPCLG